MHTVYRQERVIKGRSEPKRQRMVVKSERDPTAASVQK